MCCHRGPRSQWFWAVEARNWRCCRVAAVPSPIWYWRLTLQAKNCPQGRNLSKCWKERQSSETQIWPIRCRCTPCDVHLRPWTCTMLPIARTLRAILRRSFPLLDVFLVIFPVTESVYWMYSLAIPQAEISRVEFIVLEFSSCWSITYSKSMRFSFTSGSFRCKCVVHEV